MVFFWEIYTPGKGNTCYCERKFKYDFRALENVKIENFNLNFISYLILKLYFSFFPLNVFLSTPILYFEQDLLFKHAVFLRHQKEIEVSSENDPRLAL